MAFKYKLAMRYVQVHSKEHLYKASIGQKLMANQLNSPSTTSFQSSTTVTSTVPLNRPPQPQKDYFAAFGALQARYGAGGGLPSPKKEPSNKLPEARKSFSAPPSHSSQTTLATSTSSAPSTSSEPVAQHDRSGARRGQNSKVKKPSILQTIFKGELVGISWTIR